MGVFRGFVQEQVLDYHAFHGGEDRRHMQRVGIGLGDVLALDEQALKLPPTASWSMLGMQQARFVVELTFHKASKLSRVASSETCR